MESPLESGREGGINERARGLLSEAAGRFARLAMEPFEVEVRLASPVVVDVFSVHLDGVLAKAVLHDVGLPVENMNYVTEVWDIPLPLEREEGVWTASALWCPDAARGITYWRKRWDNFYVRWVRKRKKINIGFGAFRAYNMPMMTIAAPIMMFYGRGAVSEVFRLLKHFTHIGKKGSQGYGIVREWIVRPVRSAPCMVYEYPDGKVLSMRSLPVKWLDKHGYRARATISLAVRPPYWHPDSQDEGVLPFTEVEYVDRRTPA